MDDPVSVEVESTGDTCLACGTTDVRLNLFEVSARFEEFGAGGAVDGAIDASTAEEPFVGRVDDCVDVELGDVCNLNLDLGRHVRGSRGGLGMGSQDMDCVGVSLFWMFTSGLAFSWGSIGCFRVGSFASGGEGGLRVESSWDCSSRMSSSSWASSSMDSPFLRRSMRRV